MSATSQYVNYHQFTMDELEDRFLAASEGDRKFLHGLLSLTEQRTGGEFTLYQALPQDGSQPQNSVFNSFEPVKDKAALLKRLKEEGPVLVTQKDTANLTKAPLRRTAGGPN